MGRRLVQQDPGVIGYDRRGHGASGVGRAGYIIEAQGADLKAVLETLDLREVPVTRWGAWPLRPSAATSRTWPKSA